jgi:NitT/TauT family transport system substrate-binding protein
MLISEGQPNRLPRRDFLGRTALSIGSILAVSAIGGTACSSGGSSTGTGQQAISHLLDAMDAAPIHIANHEGLFSAEGLNLKTLNTAGGSDTIRMIVQNTGLGMPASVAVVSAFAKGISNIRVVGGIYNKPSNVLLVKAGAPFGINDLRGKKLGSGNPDSLTAYLTTALLQKKGLRAGTDVQVLNVGDVTTLWTSLDTGVVDLAWSSPPFSTQLVQDGKAVVAAKAVDVVPDLPDAVLVATTDKVSRDRTTVSGWLKAIDSAIQILRSDPERAAKAYAASAGLQLDLARRVLAEAGNGFSLRIPESGLTAATKAAVQLGQISENSRVDGLFDASLIPAGAV